MSETAWIIWVLVVSAVRLQRLQGFKFHRWPDGQGEYRLSRADQGKRSRISPGGLAVAMGIPLSGIALAIGDLLS